MISIQDRDRSILKVCYEQQFLLRSHIADHFFRGKYHAAMRRVRELCAAGFLRTERYALRGHTEVVRLGHLGKRIAPTLSVAEMPYRAQLCPELLEHDAFVTEVRLALEDRWDGVWIPEKAIRGFRPTELPDGLFLFPNGKKVALELENSLKGSTRFKNRLLRWKDFEIALVLYVATKDGLYESLQGLLQDPPEAPAFGLARLADFQQTQPPVWSPFGPLDIFSRREL